MSLDVLMRGSSRQTIRPLRSTSRDCSRRSTASSEMPGRAWRCHARAAATLGKSCESEASWRSNSMAEPARITGPASITTSASTRSGCAAAKAVATPPPIEWPMTVALFRLHASYRPRTSATYASVE